MRRFRRKLTVHGAQIRLLQTPLNQSRWYTTHYSKVIWITLHEAADA
jgi:hypothetical protein